MIGHQLIVLTVIRCLHLLDQEIDQVEQVDLVQLLLTILFDVEIDINVSLLQDKLHQPSFLLDELLVQTF